MRKIGKRGLEWARVKRKLKVLFDGLGIKQCEFRGTMCWGEGDTFAHVDRRRHLGKWDSPERYYRINNVARLCIPCHDYIDTVLGEEVGGREIQRIIDSRNNIFLLGDL